jgi:putative transposase
MPAPKYLVDLTPDEQHALLDSIRHGKKSTRQITRARVLLKADEGLTDQDIADDLHIGFATVGRVRKRFVEEGVDQALREKPRPGQRRKLTGKQEARLIAEACSAAPKGHERWTLRLLADRAVRLDLTDHLSHETVRQLLKKTN